MASLTNIGGYGSTAAGTSTIPVPLTSDINVGDAAWAIFDCSGTRVFNSVTDSQGQTWNIDAFISNSTFANLCIASLPSSAQHLVAGVDTVTANLDGSTARRMGTILALSGGGPVDGLDQTATASGTDLSPNTGTTSTLAQADEVAIGAIGWSSGSSGDSLNAPAGWTLADNEAADLSTNHKYLGVFWQETASTAPVSGAPTFNTGTTPPWSGAVATYKLPAAGSSYDQPISKIASDEAVRGIALTLDVALPLAAIPSASAIRGVGLTRALTLPLAAVPSTAALRGLDTVLATRLHLGHLPSGSAIRGVLLDVVTIQATDTFFVEVPCYNETASVSLFLIPTGEVVIFEESKEVEL